jgi:hypothetical protein
MFVKNSLLLSSLNMTTTVLPTFQTQYILDFSSASHSGTQGFANCAAIAQKTRSVRWNDLPRSKCSDPRYISPFS